MKTGDYQVKKLYPKTVLLINVSIIILKAVDWISYTITNENSWAYMHLTDWVVCTDVIFVLFTILIAITKGKYRYFQQSRKV